MNGRQVRILLVEDNPGDARLVQEILKEVEHVDLKLTHVDSLGAALDMFNDTSYDVILLDLSLPDAHGLETVNRMHRRVPDMPIVVLTGLNDEVMAMKAVQSGAQDYFVKGQVDGNLMIRAIRYAIERKRAEIEREIVKTKAIESDRLITVGRLAAGIAHELNQPLQTFKLIINNLKLMCKKGKLTEDLIVKKLAKMDQLSDYMATIIVNLLGHVRADEKYDECFLNDILTATLSIIGKQLSIKNVQVDLDVPNDFAIYCNKNAVVQVFLNLFINARDAYLEIPVEKFANADKCISVYTAINENTQHIFVKDYAGGIPPSIQNNIFEPFVSTKPAVKGTGMGLHVVRQIMRSHHGDVSYKVEDGFATTFELIFPGVQTEKIKVN